MRTCIQVYVCVCVRVCARIADLILKHCPGLCAAEGEEGEVHDREAVVEVVEGVALVQLLHSYEKTPQFRQGQGEGLQQASL